MDKKRDLRKQGSIRLILGSFALLLCIAQTYHTYTAVEAGKCPQQPEFVPQNDPELNIRYDEYLLSPEFKKSAIKRFSDSIKIDTASYDSQRGGPGSSTPDIKLHEPFLKFHKELEKNYPLIHSNLKRTIINEYSLLFEWGGLDQVQKPFMLMSHIDVVPIDPETVAQWKYDPFSGFYDGSRIWGRGSCDTKLTLVSIMEAVEALLEAGFKPKRTIFLGFGHDEEISGFNGARQIIAHLKSLGIDKDGLEFVLDEGTGLGVLNDGSVGAQQNGVKGIPFAAVGISEKGYMDVNITVTMKKGGHASVPTPHTAIGIISDIIVNIENNPPPAALRETNPILQSMQCLAEHSTMLSTRQKYMLDHFDLFKNLILKEMWSYEFLRPFLSTTQAVDVIHGGVKVNALPTSVYALINMRIAPHESVEIVSKRLDAIIQPLAVKHNMEFSSTILTHSMDAVKMAGFDDFVVGFNQTEAQGMVKVEVSGLEPSPISSTEKAAYKRLSAVTRRVFKDIVVTPFMMPANTDTRWSWDVAESIFRFDPFFGEAKNNVHTVDESVESESFIEMVRFYHELIRGYNE
jgi:Gly-Xaa carboxypeptidase